MAIITISRQYGSGGDEIAEQVCELLGYQYFDKRMIARATADAGLSEQEIVDYSEENHKVRSFLDRLFGRQAVVAQTRVWREDATGVRSAEDIKLSEETALSLVQKAVRSAYKVGNMVIVGRGGQVILKEGPDVLHVRIEAPLEERIQRVKEQIRATHKLFHADIELRREAQDLIIERDAASADYLHRFYHVDWADPLLYHLIINTGKLSTGKAIEVIAQIAREIHPVETAA
ncbi:MAG: cytidylate kinase-like family protein [Chloroflexi bacterium]|nr:MAG: cytidylate kinase-like family protein [Chloroflexota bacterium]